MQFDDELANKMLGKCLLVDIIYLDVNGNLASQQQLFGVVLSASKTDGILLELKGEHQGEKWKMPPNTDGIKAASPIGHKVISTGKCIYSPDFTYTLELRKVEVE